MSSHGVYYTKSPLLASRTPVWRSRFIIVCLALGFTVLTARAAWIQLYQYEFYQNQADMRYVRTLPLPASRGVIQDRNGIPLGFSIETPSLWASPAELHITDAQMKQLAALLGMSEDALRVRLDPGSGERKREFVWLKRLAGHELAEQVLALGIKGIYARNEYQRSYPGKEATAHVVGFTNVEDLGQEGMELAFNDLLVGKAGSERFIQDRMGRPVGSAEERVNPVNGKDIQLSIDARIQYYAYQLLSDAVKLHRAQSGSIVIIDVRTGEILALVNYPSYDPNTRENLQGSSLRNRAVTDTFEPGSTMKPIVVGRALDLGIVKPTTVIKTSPGSVVVGGKVIRDVANYPQLTVQQVIQKSSNIGVVSIAMQMTPREMWETFTELGFGQKPQIGFPGAALGRLRPYKSWRPIEQATQAYGYGLSVSLLQLAHAYTAFARDGDIIPLSLLRNDHPVQGVRVFTPETAAEIREMLHMVTLPGGAGTKAQTQGYAVGGKSGTAIKSGAGGYGTGKYRSWFVGIAPINQPRIVVAVMIDEPSDGVYYGGAVSGPVFAQVVQQSLRLLGVLPDQPLQLAGTGQGQQAARRQP